MPSKSIPQDSERKDIIVSLSLQSIASLAAKNEMTMQETAERLASFLVSLGCSKIYDINLARHIALLESVREFVGRFKEANLPVLNSTCPGWVCYVEKTHGQLLIPKLSRVKSPQQIMASLLKRLQMAETTIDAKKVYHVTIMPCFDKKLEASREEFQDSQDGSKDVDLVLTPIELESIMEREEVTLGSLNRRKLDILSHPVSSLEEMSSLTSHSGSSSGGYAENILNCAAQILFPDEYQYVAPQLKRTVCRNSDFIELELYSSRTPSDKPLLRFAVVNGFRNIQTLVQRIKRNALKYDYVEVMACPSGCINGGAQSKSSLYSTNIKHVDKDFLRTAQSLYDSVKQLTVDCQKTDDIYHGLGLFNDLTDRHLYTSFHSIPKSQNLLVNW